MSDDPKGFEENPKAALTDNDEENVIDESIFGPQKVLTPKEQAEYDAWLRKKVGRTMQRIKEGTVVSYSHEEVMANVEELLERLDREAGLK